jgi:hypothetical protein
MRLHRHILLALSLSCAFFLQSCAAPYVQPSAGKRATISFSDASTQRSPGLASVSISEDDSCNAPFIKKESWKNSVIPAGKRITVIQNGLMHPYSCAVGITFIPEEGSSYVSEYRFINITRCSVALFKVDGRGQRSVDSTVVLRPEKFCL